MSEDVGTAALPAAVRRRLVALAAEALGALAPEDVPPALARIARFAPARRAKAGAGAIAAALESDADLRERVLDRAAGGEPELVAAARAGAALPAADPVELAALAYLARAQGWVETVRSVAEPVAPDPAYAAQRARLEEHVRVARAGARDDRAARRADVRRLEAEVAALRRTAAGERDRAAAAQDAASRAAQDAAATVVRGQSARSAAEAEVRRLRARVVELERDMETLRRADREGRRAATLRTRLLLDQVVDAAAGLRRELAVPPVHDRPADLVAAVRPGVPGEAAPAVRAADDDDPALLDALLTLPQVHLVVDGYNVTKQDWGTMPLDAQRARLLSALAVLAAARGAEVTCVFDGADLAAPPVVATPRGVRVLFSAPGQTADDLIRGLVRAEPAGRTMAVVSTDREVAEGVRGPGVHPVRSRALVRLLSGGR